MESTKYIFTAGSDDWLTLRSNNITGSDVATLFGMNKYKSLNKLRKEKLTGESEFTQTKFVIAGRILEPTILLYLSEVLNRKVIHCGGVSEVVVYKHNQARLSCTLDGLLNSSIGEIPVECKTMNLKTFSKYHKDDIFYIPLNYLLQLAVQSMCLGCEYGILTFCIYKTPDDINTLLPIEIIEFIPLSVKFNTKIYELILKEVEYFYNKVLTDKSNSVSIRKGIKEDMMELLSTCELKIIT